MTWTAVLGLVRGLLSALARAVTPILLWMGGKASARADGAEKALRGERDRVKADADIARLPTDDLDSELRRYERRE